MSAEISFRFGVFCRLEPYFRDNVRRDKAFETLSRKDQVVLRRNCKEIIMI